MHRSIDTDRYISPVEVKYHLDSFIEYITAVSKQDKTLYSKSVEQYSQMREELLVGLNTLDAVLAKNGHTSPSPAKTIMAHYFSAIQSLKSDESYPKYIQEFIVLFSQWFSCRFNSANAVSFQYSAVNIWRWIDMYIVAYACYYNRNQMDQFESAQDRWLLTLKDSAIKQYPLFSEASSIGNNELNISPEAVVIEHYVKESLYTVDFYPEHRSSVLESYITTWGDSTYENICLLSRMK